VDHEHLRSFEAFARHLSFTAAAQERHLSQPALFVQVQKLQASVGVRLYEKRGRTLSLTEAGARTALHAREALDADASLLAELRGEKAERPLTLACGEGAFLHLVGPALAAERGRTGDPLRVSIRDQAATVAAVRSGEAHLGVTVAATDSSDLEHELLWSGRPHVLLPTRHRLAKARSIKLVDLLGEPFVVAPEGTPTRLALAAALRASGGELRIGLEAEGWEAQRHAVRWGLGLAVVSGICAPLPGTVARPLAASAHGLLPATRYVLLRRRERSARADLEPFIATIRRGISARPGPDS
jgi:LysR family transcriptional regulator, low CO2-responsive transcriptional regulator